MRRNAAAAGVAGLAGLVIGMSLTALPWRPAWPGLCILNVWRGAAVGWLLGLGVAAPVCWLLSRRAPAQEQRCRSRRRRVVHTTLIGVSLAPGVVWLTVVVPGTPLRRALAASRPLGDTRPNLVLITVDALRPDVLGAYGSAEGLSPNIDAFARDATRYDSAYASSPWTLPSLAALFTSELPSRSVGDAPAGADRNLRLTLRDDVPTLPERLRALGYVTAAELTNHFLGEDRGWSRGFDWFRNESPGDDPNSPLLRGGNITARASEWIQLSRREPFFLWVHYFDTHIPYDSPDTPPKLREQWPSWWVADRATWMRRMSSERGPKRSNYMEFCRAMYREEVRYADRSVGEFLKRLKEQGLYDRSLIVISADHGEELFDRSNDLAMEHGHNLHEPVLHVPLLVKWPPGMEADRSITRTVGWADLHATFLQFAVGQTAEKGKSQGLPRRDGGKGAEVFSEWMMYGKQQASLTTDDYRVIYHPDQAVSGGTFEVYDRTDRQEQHDLSATHAAEELRTRLRRLTQVALETRRQGGGRLRSIPFRLPEKTRQSLKSLGYMGD
jgi:arylsulfatase